METFYNNHAYLMDHFNADSQVRRSLMDTIDWSYRMIGIKGPRGVGRTSFLLQYAKENFDINLHQCLYINVNNFYFQAHGIVEFAGRFVADGGQCLLIDQAFKLTNWREQLCEIYHKYPYLASSILPRLSIRATEKTLLNFPPLAVYTYCMASRSVNI